MTTFVTLQQIDEAVDSIRERISNRPRVGMILGSGLNSLADSVQNAQVIPYRELPNWPVSTVQGHAGQLVIGELEGQSVFVMQGRIHFYEGYSMSQITLPVMLITDNLNLIGMMGANPLMGPNIDELGPRFPDMSQAYDRELMTMARQVAADQNITLREGIYCALSGPSFEGPADLRFLRMAGADAVGMSTAPEVIVARHGGMRVLGFSGISNKANLDGSTVTTHEEVIEAGTIITPKMEKIIRGVLRSL
jgi:purine-nucleoside phosphorylase